MPNNIPSELPTKAPVDSPSEVVSTGKGPLKREGVIRKRKIKKRMVLKKSASISLEAIHVKESSHVKQFTAKTPLNDQKTASQTADRYIRLRVRVEDGKLSIVDSHVVSGKLVLSSQLGGKFAYEVTLGDRQLHADSIPDLGVKRAFPNPEGPPYQRVCRVTELSSYEFDVRLPMNELKRSNLPKLDIVLYRIKERPNTRLLSKLPLSTQFKKQLREVARLHGITENLFRSIEFTN